nr:MAG TPA: hypothetical protein [Caudoviricetes sp.]
MRKAQIDPMRTNPSWNRFPRSILLSSVWHGGMEMQRSIKPFLRGQPAPFRLNLDKPVAFVGNPDVDICFAVYFGVMAVDESIQQPLFVSRNGNRRQPFVYHALFDSTPLRQFLPSHAGIFQKYPDFSLEVIHASIFRIHEILARFFLGIFVHKKYLLTFVRDERKNVFAIK